MAARATTARRKIFQSASVIRMIVFVASNLGFQSRSVVALAVVRSIVIGTSSSSSSSHDVDGRHHHSRRAAFSCLASSSTNTRPSAALLVIRPNGGCGGRRSFHGSTTTCLAGSEKSSDENNINNDKKSEATTTTSSSVSFDQEILDVERDLEEAIALCAKNRASMTPIHQLKEAIKDLEKEQSDPSFWDEGNNARASQVNAKFSEYKRLLDRIDKWEEWEGDAEAALEFIQSPDLGISREEQRMLLEECRDATKKLSEDSKSFELGLLLSGPYDQAPARLVLTAGAGGTEANDWVADLKRMYERHCENMGFTCITEDSQPGDVVGYKSVDMLISGPNAYGWFQGEKGAHRLVRLSPFNANNKRQTTFAGVDVAPADVLDETTINELEIPDRDLEITNMRSSGAGGQNVNKVSSAVRIKHLPSGLQVKVTQERNQIQNKKIALNRLKAQLLAIAREQRVKEINEIKGDMVEASWGAQIRNYVLHPYKMVKDQRTGWETSNAQAFLDGDLLEECIGAYLRHKAKVEQEQSFDS